jgi:hypothetical protein
MRPTSTVVLAPLLKQLLRLTNARLVSMHEVVVRMSLGKRVPLGRLKKILQRRDTVYLVQPVQRMWNVVIVEVRHEQQTFPSSSKTRCT